MRPRPTPSLCARAFGGRGCSSTAGRFSVVRQRAEGHGGALLFEAVHRGRALRAETVVISSPRPWDGAGRGATVCVSSQAGCPLDCSFCDTGGMARASNLPSWAIVAQVGAARRLQPDLRRVVFMGMGEPLLNYREVSQAISELQREAPFARPFAITVSTVGVPERIARLALEHPDVALAVSLHAPQQELRERLLPEAARRWPLSEVMAAVWAHEEATRRAPMFAYVLLPGVNSSPGDAASLSELLTSGRPGAPRPCVNLIPYNRTAVGARQGYEAPKNSLLREFQAALRSMGVRASVRWSTAEGRPLAAACGQLAARDAPREPGEPGERPPEPGEPGEAAEPVPHALTRRLARAATADEVFDLTREHEAELNDIHLSAALVTLARTSARLRAPVDPEGLAVLLRVLARLLRSQTMGAQACANALWAFGKLRFTPQELEELAGASVAQLSSFWPQSLANSVGALAQLRCDASAGSVGLLASGLAEQLAVRSSSLAPVEFANSLFALARLRHAPPLEGGAAGFPRSPWATTALAQLRYYGSKASLVSLCVLLHDPQRPSVPVLA